MFCLTMVACGDHFRPTIHDEVRKAAENYYSYLMDGDYEQYVRGIHDVDSMDSSYYRQMVDLMAQHMSEVKASRKGLRSAEALSDTIVDDVADVILRLKYGDGSSERVVLPLVNVDGYWRLQ